MRYAREDLETAEQLMKSAISPRHVCFLAQQAAEKAIKAILVLHQIDFPRSHDLELLINFIPPDWSIRNANLDVAALTEWAVEARYPGDWPEATLADARAAFTTAFEVVQTISDDLNRKVPHL
ncbi:MAG: HEPN domain-containing protein [Armatimonadetes bacterium]|nr:HEPN domain-containing protein [Armatimonadota bacterium]